MDCTYCRIVLLLIFFSFVSFSFVLNKCFTSVLLCNKLKKLTPIKHWQHLGRFIPDDFYHKLNEGLVSYQELEVLFPIGKDRLLEINQVDAQGFVGFVVNFENILINALPMYSSCILKLATAYDQPAPSVEKIKELIGIPILDGLNYLEWDFHTVEELRKCENDFYHLIQDFVLNNVITIAPHVMEFLQRLLQDHNDISVISFLPRNVVQQIFTKTSLVRMFRGKVSPKQLFTLPPLSELSVDVYKGPFQQSGNRDSTVMAYKHAMKASGPEGAAYVRTRYIAACGYMHKLPCECLLIDGIATNIIQAKQLGMNCIALTGFAQQYTSLRYANRIVSSLSDVDLVDIYKIVKRTIKFAQGPEKQLDLRNKFTPKRVRRNFLHIPTVNPKKILNRKALKLIEHIQFMEANNITLTEKTIENYFDDSPKSVQGMKSISPSIYDFQKNRKEANELEDMTDDEKDEDEENDEDEKEEDEDNTDDIMAQIRKLDGEVNIHDDEIENEEREETPKDKLFVRSQLNKFYSLVNQIEFLQKQIQMESQGEEDDGMKKEEKEVPNITTDAPLLNSTLEKFQKNLLAQVLADAEVSAVSEEEEYRDDEYEEDYANYEDEIEYDDDHYADFVIEDEEGEGKKNEDDGDDDDEDEDNEHDFYAEQEELEYH